MKRFRLSQLHVGKQNKCFNYCDILGIQQIYCTALDWFVRNTLPILSGGTDLFVWCCLLSAPQIENVDTCLNFLDARGVNVQGLSAEGKTVFTDRVSHFLL